LEQNKNIIVSGKEKEEKKEEIQIRKGFEMDKKEKTYEAKRE